MIWILLLASILLILVHNKNVVPVYMIASMWINFDVRCGPLSFISMLSIFIIIYGFITSKRNLRFETSFDKRVYGYCLYMVLIHIPFIIFSTDLNFLYQLNSIKSNILNFVLLIILWMDRNINGHIMHLWYIYILDKNQSLYGCNGTILYSRRPVRVIGTFHGRCQR